MGFVEKDKKRSRSTRGSRLSQDVFEFHGSSDVDQDVEMSKDRIFDASLNSQSPNTNQQEHVDAFPGGTGLDSQLRGQSNRCSKVGINGEGITLIEEASKDSRKRRRLTGHTLGAAGTMLPPDDTTWSMQRESQDCATTGTWSPASRTSDASADKAARKKRPHRRVTIHEAIQGTSSNEHSHHQKEGTLPQPLLKSRQETIKASTVLEDSTFPPTLMQEQIQLSDSSTIPNTTPGSSMQAVISTLREGAEIPGPDISSDWMPTPTRSSKSVSNLEGSSALGQISTNFRSRLDPEFGILDTTQDLDQAVDSSAAPVSVSAAIHAYSEDLHDELSATPLPGEALPVGDTQTTTKEKRKTIVDSQQDQLFSDEISVGLPKEQYQPRPSRSRSGQTSNDVLFPTDFSKRPEALIKSKSKRRKTNDGECLLHEESSEDLVHSNTLPKEVLHPREETLESPNVPEYAVPNNHDEAVEDHKPLNQPDSKPAANTTEPKKIRGRPKKQSTEAAADNPAPALIEQQHDEKLVEPETPAKPPPPKKTRKKKKSDKPGPAPATLDAEPPRLPIAEIPNTTPLEPVAGNTPTPAPLPDITTITNPPTIKATTPSPASTPLKADPKGSGKPSPLSKGRLQYRVGLSRNARIAPLLKVVRK